MRTYLTVVIAAALVGCGGSQSGELASLQNRVFRLEQAQGKAPTEGAGGPERVAAGDPEAMAREIRYLTDEVTKLRQRIALLEIRGAPAAAAERPAPRPRRPRPDPDTVYAVPVAGSPSVGRRDALVTIVKGFEFACPYCNKVRQTLEQLQQQYGSDLRIVYKNFIVHPSAATIPAYAACAADKQGKWKQMAELIWTKGFEANRNLSRDNMVAIAKSVGLNIRKFERDMDGEPCKRRVREDQAMLARFGVRGTPAFFINGRFLSGARPIQQFQDLIDDELAKARARVRKGTRKRDYYKTHVIGAGKQGL